MIGSNNNAQYYCAVYRGKASDQLYTQAYPLVTVDSLYFEVLDWEDNTTDCVY